MVSFSVPAIGLAQWTDFSLSYFLRLSLHTHLSPPLPLGYCSTMAGVLSLLTSLCHWVCDPSGCLPSLTLAVAWPGRAQAGEPNPCVWSEAGYRLATGGYESAVRGKGACDSATAQYISARERGSRWPRHDRGQVEETQEDKPANQRGR